MSSSMFLYSPFDRLAIEAEGGTLWVRGCNEYGGVHSTVALIPTSLDVAALRAALDKLDTTKADQDLADEQGEEARAA